MVPVLVLMLVINLLNLVVLLTDLPVWADGSIVIVMIILLVVQITLVVRNIRRMKRGMV